MTARIYLSLFYLLATGCVAVNQGYLPKSIAEVPYATGFLMKLDQDMEKDCMQGDEALGSSCSGGLISEGVFLTAAHCFENGPADSAANGTLNLANLRVGLGARYPYRNNDGTCTGQIRGTSEQIYKVKAVFIHKHFKPISETYSYNNGKTGKSESGEVFMDHMDVAVALLDECTSPVAGSNKPRHGKIAGGKFSELALMWKSFGSKTNTEGLPGTYWGYGESEDDTITKDSSGKLVPKPVRRANWNFNRGTSLPNVPAGSQRKVWANCDWLPDSTAVWSFSNDNAMEAYKSSGGQMKAAPFLACTPRNPNDRSVKSRCEDQVTSGTCLEKKSKSGKSFCKWAGGTCEIDPTVVGGIGLVKYPSSGGGDSGAAAWYIENADKLALHDRDQLNLVHIGVIYAATSQFPEWDQVLRTDYYQNWLATVIDRDSCAAKSTKDYFVGFDDSVVDGPSSKPPVTQSGWDLDLHYTGIVKGVSGAVGLSQMPKRANAGDWSAGSSTGGATGGTNAGGTTTTGGTNAGGSTTAAAVQLPVESTTTAGATQKSTTRGAASNAVAVKSQLVGLGLVLGLTVERVLCCYPL